MTKTLKEAGTLSVDSSTSKIEAIKNLLFGENIAEYNQEFEDLKKDLEKRRTELLDYIDDTRKELMTAIDSLGTDVNIRISDLETSILDKTEELNKTKMSKESLGDLLIQLGTKVKAD